MAKKKKAVLLKVIIGKLGVHQVEKEHSIDKNFRKLSRQIYIEN